MGAATRTPTGRALGLRRDGGRRPQQEQAQQALGQPSQPSHRAQPQSRFYPLFPFPLVLVVYI